MPRENFKKLIQSSNSVDLPSIFDIAAKLTQAQLAGSQGSVATGFVQTTFDQHIDRVSWLILEAMKIASDSEEK